MLTAVYWLLLIYMIAALIWWFIALESQNQKVYRDHLQQLPSTAIDYASKKESLIQASDRKSMQYVGEGVTFLLVILAGAVFVFRSVRKEFKLSLQQRDFMMAVTHELKTPVAAIQLNVQTIQKRKLEQRNQDIMLDGVAKECSRLNMLTQNILLTSQFESGVYNGIKQNINLSEIVKQTVEEYTLRYPNRNIIYDEPGKALNIKGEANMMQMAISNLLENALKYSASEKPVTIKLMQENRAVMLMVKDEGIGLPIAERKDIFKKFYRSQSHSKLNVKGTGLGLYLCKKIITDHKGILTVSDNIPAGLVFSITLPHHYKPTI